MSDNQNPIEPFDGDPGRPTVTQIKVSKSRGAGDPPTYQSVYFECKDTVNPDILQTLGALEIRPSDGGVTIDLEATVTVDTFKVSKKEGGKEFYCNICSEKQKIYSEIFESFGNQTLVISFNDDGNFYPTNKPLEKMP